jgi:hypothetical protein
LGLKAVGGDDSGEEVITGKGICIVERAHRVTLSEVAPKSTFTMLSYCVNFCGWSFGVYKNKVFQFVTQFHDSQIELFLIKKRKWLM